MGRPTKEVVKKRKELIKTNKEIFNTLKNCGGGLYINDLAILLGISINTLKYRLDKCEELDLVIIDKVTQATTSKNIVRLSKIGWTNLGINRGKCSSQEDTLNFFFYRAIYQRHFSYIDENKNMFIFDERDEFKRKVSEILNCNDNLERTLKIIDSNNNARNQKSIIENLDILNKSNIIISFCLLTKGMIRLTIDCTYRRFDLKTAAEYMDLVAGICEMCAFLLNDDYFQSKNFIKIDFRIITEYKLNKSEVCKQIKKHKRNFYAFTKESTVKPNMYNTFRYIYKNRIEFHYIDKKQGKVIKY